jgi:hypothetical protein
MIESKSEHSESDEGEESFFKGPSPKSRVDQLP